MRDSLYVRIDNRLLHGQVVQFWIPHLGVEHLIVADDGVSKNLSMQVVYRMALPAIVKITIVPVDRVGGILSTAISSPTMLLIKDIASTKRIVAQGDFFKHLTIGNVHASPERERVTDAVYLSGAEIETLLELKKAGIEIEIQTFPGEVLRFLGSKKGGFVWGK
jgi:mannose/fructose/N-acetylgalactosamine-specific phosphotransferase system component IIB